MSKKKLVNPDTEKGLALEIAHMYYSDKRITQKNVAQIFGMQQSQVSELLDKCKSEKWVTTVIESISYNEITENILNKINSELVHNIHIVPQKMNSKKNEKNIADRTAKRIKEILSLLLQNTSSKPIKLGIGGGVTIEKTIDYFSELVLSDKQLQSALSNRGLDIYPIILQCGFDMDQNDSYRLMLNTFITMSKLLSNVKVHVANLPKNYKDIPQSKKDVILEYYGFNGELKDACSCDIYLVGVGSTNDALTKIYSRNYTDDHKSLMRNMPVVNYQPIGANGNTFDNFDKKVVGLSIGQLRKIASNSEQYVIALGGGSSKVKSFPAIFEFPFYNELVTDVECVYYYLEGSKPYYKTVYEFE